MRIEIAPLNNGTRLCEPSAQRRKFGVSNRKTLRDVNVELIFRARSFRLLEAAADTDANLIETQEFFDLMTSVSQNPIGRDIVWNFYRHNYEDLLTRWAKTSENGEGRWNDSSRFGPTNRLFNQWITNLAQSFENEYYYFEVIHLSETHFFEVIFSLLNFVDAGFCSTVSQFVAKSTTSCRSNPDELRMAGQWISRGSRQCHY